MKEFFNAIYQEDPLIAITYLIGVVLFSIVGIIFIIGGR